MKKFVIIGILAIVVLVGGTVTAAKLGVFKMSLGFLDGEKEKVKRGDMEIPISAIGTVESRKLIEIKSKASGQLNGINVVEGQMVEKGHILAELDPVDETRNVESREAAVARASSVLEKAKVTLEDLKVQLPYQTSMAEERVKDAEASAEAAEHSFGRIERLHNQQKASENEFIQVRSTHRRAQAALELAKIDLGVAKQNEISRVKQAEEDIVSAEANLTEAQKALEDSSQRLKETTIVAPTNAMVYSILRKEGEMIQSGTASLTGGTAIMYLADISSMFVIAQVDEADIGAIRDIAPEYARPGGTKMLDEDEYKVRANRIINRAQDEDDDSSNERVAGGTNGDDKPGGGYDHTEDEADASRTAPESIRRELEGRPVKVTVEAYRSEEFKGVIERILPDPIQTGGSVAFRVRIRLIGDDVEKLMGLQADLSFETKTQEDVLLVPNEALRSEGTECYVFIPHKEKPSDRLGTKKVWVKIGETDGVNTVIHDGLKEGDEVWIKTPVLTSREQEEQDS